MPRFAANLSMLYPEHAFLDRFEAAAKDGFDAVEFLFPYAYPAREIRARLEAHGLVQALFNAPPGGVDAASIDAAWAAGDRGTACVPGREAEFRTGLQLALDHAQALQCSRVHVMAGLVQGERQQARRVYEANLRWAANEAKAVGVDVLIEPINPRDMPGFFLNRQDDAHDTLARIGAPNLKVQMDLYHCQIVEGDLATKLRRYLPTGRVGHLQIAGVPERHEPDIGELNPAYLCALIDEIAAQTGWQGFVGCEYRPRAATSDGLGWMRAAMAAGPAQR